MALRTFRALSDPLSEPVQAHEIDVTSEGVLSHDAATPEARGGLRCFKYGCCSEEEPPDRTESCLTWVKPKMYFVRTLTLTFDLWPAATKT